MRTFCRISCRLLILPACCHEMPGRSSYEDSPPMLNSGFILCHFGLKQTFQPPSLIKTEAKEWSSGLEMQSQETVKGKDEASRRP